MLQFLLVDESEEWHRADVSLYTLPLASALSARVCLCVQIRQLLPFANYKDALATLNQV